MIPMLQLMSRSENGLRNPSTTKSGPGRRHVEGHKRASPIANKRNGKIGSGWMGERLMRWIADANLQKIPDRRERASERSARSQQASTQAAVLKGVGERFIEARMPESSTVREGGTLVQGTLSLEVNRDSIDAMFSTDGILQEMTSPIVLQGGSFDFTTFDQQSATEAATEVMHASIDQLSVALTKAGEAVKTATMKVDDVAQTLANIEQRSDEDVIYEAIETNPGASFSLIAKFLPNLSETQLERRLKKLRESGKIAFNKTAKGWFVVTGN